MDDTTCDNLIDFNESPVHKFVPLVPLPAEEAFLGSGNLWPFDNMEAASGHEDPFEVVLRSVTGQIPCGGFQEPSQCRNDPCVLESSDLPHGDSASQTHALKVDSSPCAGKTVGRSRVSVGDLLSVRMHEKLDGCIQMMLNGSRSQQQQQGVDVPQSLDLLSTASSTSVRVSSSGLPSTPGCSVSQCLCGADGCVREKCCLAAPDYCCPQDADMADSNRDRVAWEALRVANTISHGATGDALDESLDGIEVDLLSSDEEDEEFVEHVQLYKPPPLNLERVSSLSLRHPEPLDHCKLVTRLKELKAANHLPEGKLGPLKAIIPVADMSKVAATSCVGGRDLPSKALRPSLSIESRQNNPGDVVAKASALTRCKQQASANSTSGKSRLCSPSRSSTIPPSFTNATHKAGLKGKGLPVHHGIPGFHATPNRAAVTEDKKEMASHLAASRESARTSRRMSNSPKAYRVAAGGGCDAAVVSRRSKSASNVTPMRSVENQVLSARRADKGSPFMKRTSVRAVRNKENIFPA